MSEQINPIFAIPTPPGQDNYLSVWNSSSPWPEAEVAFHWTNFDYPRPHIHEYWEMLILVSGTLRHRINSKTTILKPRQACLLRPDDCHALFAVGNEPVMVLNFMIKKEYIGRLFSICGKSMVDAIHYLEDLSFTVSSETFDRCVTDTQALQTNVNMPLESKIEHCKALFFSLISELMRRIIEDGNTQPIWLSNFLIKLSQSDLSNVEITTKLYSDTTYSYSRLIHLFKKHMGCTISQYISYLRVERAKEFLRNTNMHIIDVAAASGFENIAHFNRTFKKSTGITPSQFRSRKSRTNPPLKDSEK